MSFSNKSMKDLYDMFELNHLIKDPTCLKSSNRSCIENFYTNKKTMYFNLSTVVTYISDHHSLIFILSPVEYLTVEHSTFTIFEKTKITVN